jgi:hypothetical protein
MWMGFLKDVKAEVEPMIQMQVREFRTNKVKPPMWWLPAHKRTA